MGSDTKIDISGGENTPLNRSTELTTKSPLDRGEVITKAGTLSERAEGRRLRGIDINIFAF